MPNTSIAIRVWLFICCKTKLKKKYFFFEKICFLQNIHYLQKKCFYMEKKSFILKIFFTEEKLFYREKYKWKCKNIFISFEKYLFMQKMFVLQIKYKSSLNYIHSAKKIFFWSYKIYLWKLRCELNNLVLKVSGAPNLWYSLNYLFPKHKRTSWKKFMTVFILGNVEGWRLGT